MIIDMYSRKIVGWDVFTREDGHYAKMLFARAFEKEGVKPSQITVHSDNGKPMRSKKLKDLFFLLQVTPSFSRPHTSNDNAYSESLFSTMKGRVAYPEFFASLQAALDYCEKFVKWYNECHLHSGLDYVTPVSVHEGRHEAIYQKRNELLEQDRLLHPKRHGGLKKVYHMQKEVRLRHRVHIDGKSEAEGSHEGVVSEKKKVTLRTSKEAEVGSAEEQPTRNTLTDRNVQVG